MSNLPLITPFTILCNYKGIKYYYIHGSYYNETHFEYNDINFYNKIDIEKYIDKIVLREKKLERLRVV